MERDFETVMIEQCAPVLAGLKPAGLFRYETRNRADLARRVAGWNAQLNPKGLQVRVLRGCIATRQYLVYVYRAAKLQTVLADAAVRGFLAREGYRLSDISAAVQAYVEANGFSVVREYVGHGIGHQMHEAPEVPNYGKPGHGPRLLRGMTIAVEPMVNAGTAAIRQMPDGWTVRTADGKNAAHYENTVLITDGEPELLTDPEKSLV